MEESASQILLQLTTGAAGGIAVGMLFERLGLGRVLNPIVGAVGGAIGCMALEMLGWAGLSLIADLASSTLGGAVLVLAIGATKRAMIRG